MTKRATPAWAEPHDTPKNSHLAFAVGQDFAAKLRTAMDQAGLTPSGLARKIWGNAAPTAKGYVSAKNRDRVSKYLAGKVIPDAATLPLLAEALNVPEESLAPQVVGNRLEREHPEVRLTVIAGYRDRVHLTLNSAMALSKAIKIIALIDEQEDPNAPRLELREPEGREDRELEEYEIKGGSSLQEWAKQRFSMDDNALSVHVFKHALSTVKRKRTFEITPELRIEFEAAIAEALAVVREQIDEQRNSISTPEARSVLVIDPKPAAKRSRRAIVEDTVHATQ